MDPGGANSTFWGTSRRSVMQRKRSIYPVIASGMLFMAVVGVVVRSYFISESFVYRSLPDAQGRMRVQVLEVVFGGIIYGRGSEVLRRGASEARFLHQRFPVDKVHQPLKGWRRWVGFDVQAAHGWTTITLPLWPLAVLCLIFVARWMLLTRRDRRRRQSGRCIACGYDLRASPDRCPECGSVPEPLVRLK